MPRYRLTTRSTTDDELGVAVAFAAQRFPELEVKRLSRPGDPDQRSDQLLVRAPSEAHVWDWATAVAFEPAAVDPIGASA
jgi:hypothetical protein